MDDDPDIREGMQVRLKYSGYDTCFATDAVSGVAAAVNERPDLMILDLGLPEGGGFVVIERLRADPSLGAIPIIVVSASDARANQERAIKAGATAYLQKPVDNAEFMAVIRKALGEQLPTHPLVVAGLLPVARDDLDQEARLQVQLAAIRQGFLQRLQGELPLLGTLLARIRGGDSTVLVQLQSLAHRIQGSAATFDFLAISESAGQVDMLLEELLRIPAASIAEPGEVPRLLECGERLAREVGAATARE